MVVKHGLTFLLGRGEFSLTDIRVSMTLAALCLIQALLAMIPHRKEEQQRRRKMVTALVGDHDLAGDGWRN